MSTPQLRFIGLQPSDIEPLHIPDEAKLPLTQRDRSLIDSLTQRPSVTENQLLHEQVRNQICLKIFLKPVGVIDSRLKAKLRNVSRLVKYNSAGFRT